MAEFKIEKCKFYDEPGAMVTQLKDGNTVVEQFIPGDCLQDFCRGIGKPELYTEYISQNN